MLSNSEYLFRTKELRLITIEYRLRSFKKGMYEYKLNIKPKPLFDKLSGKLHSTNWFKLWEIDLSFLQVKVQYYRYNPRYMGHIETMFFNYKFFFNW